MCELRKILLSDVNVVKTFPSCESLPLHGSSFILIRKVLSFFFLEGIKRTFRKIHSKNILKKIEAMQTYGFDDQGHPFVSYDNVSCYILDKAIDSSCIVNPFEYGRYNGKVSFHYKNVAEVDLKQPVFVFGFGGYVRSYLLPKLKKMNRLVLVDYNDVLLSLGKKNFRFCYNSLAEVLPLWSKSDRPIAFIASYHSDHAWMASKLAIANNSGAIMVEKPPCVMQEDILLYKKLFMLDQLIEIGFNRRYAPAIKYVHDVISPDKPLLITCIVNEVSISTNHWYHWKNQGTRFTGNGCHWVDLACHFIKAKPVENHVIASGEFADDVAAIVRFDDGSLLSLMLTDKGSTLRGVQEHIIIKQDGMTCVIDDFINVKIIDKRGRKRMKRFWYRDKGHDRMYKSFIRRATSGSHESFYSFEDLEKVVKITRDISNQVESRMTARKKT